MRRGLAIVGAAVAAGATLGLAGIGGAAKPDKPKPKPKLELRTETQDEALDRRAIKIAVSSKRGDEVRAKATLVVDGFPDAYTFRLGPESKRLRNGEATVKLRLSARQREVLAFAAQACDKATIDAEARAAKRTGTLTETLRAEDC